MTTAQEIRHNFWNAKDNGFSTFCVQGYTMSTLATKGNDWYIASLTIGDKTYSYKASRNASSINSEYHISEQIAKLIEQ